jgi:exodeoxyribonuclease VII large subunit
MTNNTRIDLKVPYSEKDQAKVHGAQWDTANRVWYAPAGTDLRNLKRWLPNGILEGTSAPLTTPPSAKVAEKGVSLSELLGQVKGVIDEGFPSAVWVRAEISELRGKNGHLYLTLTERNERGDILAQAKGVIWRNRAEAITAKFREATGDGIKTDIKILCLSKVRFDPLYGLDLIIEDVDPSYTLGDLAAKLVRIREKLQQTGLYGRNKQLPAPLEFVRVAVISPETSAGLGDFRREADLLQTAKLCEFYLFPATFQGVETSSSIQSAVLQALTAHKQKPFDVLVIIRGGGSVTDLAWLNDLDLAKLLCQSPVPVFTGIGHERDNTILDEIAYTRFDTPSKVVLHITTTIKDNALGAIEAWERINALVGRIISKERTMLATQADRIETGARSVIKRVQSEQEGFIKLIRSVTAQVREATIALETQQRRLIDSARLIYRRRDPQAVRRALPTPRGKRPLQWH